MKFTFFIAFILVLKTSSYSQEDSIVPSKYRWKIGISSNFGVENRMEDLTTTNSITYSNHEHFFSLGFIKSCSSFESIRKNGGVEFNYNFYPNTNFKKIDLFLFNRTFFLIDKYKGGPQYVNLSNTPIQYDNITWRSKRLFLESFVGYGLRWNLSKRLYLSQCNGLGITFEGSEEETTFQYHPEKNWKSKTNIFDDTTDAGFSIQLGLGFRL